MSESNEQVEEIEKSSEEKDVFVVDPEDYQQTQKLKTIHKARQNVQKIRRNKREKVDQYSQFDNIPWYEIYHTELAEAVASYGHEVAPIIESANKDGVIDGEMLEVRDYHILNFIYNEGRVKKTNNDVSVPNPRVSMGVYRQIDSILKELGLGLSLEQDDQGGYLDL